jgi:hypothetical protein
VVFGVEVVDHPLPLHALPECEPVDVNPTLPTPFSDAAAVTFAVLGAGLVVDMEA